MASRSLRQSPLLAYCLISSLTAATTVMADQRLTALARPEAAAAGNGEAVLSEVIVTAQKRAENVQTVPISISVVSGRELDRASVASVTDVLNSVPGVSATVGYQGGATQIAVRGVSAASPLFNSSSPIGYYLDSIPFGFVRSSIAPDANAYDLNRVEVLRGPQGTLYGASALNGVVRVLTKDADLNDFEFKGRASVSTTDFGGGNYGGDMAANLPIVPGKLAARLVVGDDHYSGWINSPNEVHVNDEDVKNIRLKINAQPTDELAMAASVWHSQIDDGAPPISLDNRTITATTPQPIHTDYTAYGLKVGYDFPAFTLTSNSSYLDYRNDSNLDESPAGLLEKGAPIGLYGALTSKVFSEELLANSKSGSPFKWSTGVFYRNDRDTTYQTLGNIIPAPVDFTDTSKSWAVFGEVGQKFLDNHLEWTLGLRRFQDEVATQQNILFGQPAGSPLIRQSATSSATTPRAVLTWYPDTSLMMYASYSQGFRSGFPQDYLTLLSAPGFPALKPDKLSNYEVGAKDSLLDSRIVLDTAIYYIDWKNVQQPLGIPYNGATIYAPVNGNAASGLGVDFSVTAHPLDVWQIGLNFSWNGLSVDSDVISQGVLLFSKGARLNYSPQYTAGAATQYSIDFGGSGFKGRLSASANYTSGQDSREITAANVLAVYSGNSTLMERASFALDAPSNWSGELYVDNISNAHGAVLRNTVPEWALRVRPRTVGLQIDYHLK